MDGNLKTAAERIQGVKNPEDVFGVTEITLPPEILLEFLEKEYRPLKELTRPEIYSAPEDIEIAEDVDAQLEKMYELAKQRIRFGLWGHTGFGRIKPASVTRFFTVGPNRFYIGEVIRREERATEYRAFWQRDQDWIGEVAIKIVSDPSNNIFAANEVRILDILHTANVPQWKHLPLVVDRFESGGRNGVIFRAHPGFTFDEVRKHRNYLDGVDQLDVIWMLDRVLSCFGYVHQMGIVHCNFGPRTAMIQPRPHNVIVRGWESGIHNPAITGEIPQLTDEIFSAPEVKNHGHIGPWSDVYSIGKTFIWMLGGDPHTNELPRNVADEFQNFLHRMVLENENARPTDAWELHRVQTEFKRRLWGCKYRHFDMA